MRKISILLIALSLLSVACTRKGSADNKSQELLIGRWWSMVGSEKVTLEFAKDGTSKTTLVGQTTNGTYKWVDDSTIELNGKQRAKVTVTQDELTMVIGNETSKFQREKTAASSPGGAGPASGSGTSGIIEKAVLAKRITPLSRTPVEVTDKFPSTGSIWAVATVSNAPPDTHVKAVMTAVSVTPGSNGNAIPPNTKLSESEVTTKGSENVGLGWPSYNDAPVGAYKVDIYLNGKLERTLAYSISKEAAPSSDSAPKPGAIGSCAKLPPSVETPPGFPIGVTLAQGIDGQGKPANPGRMFRPDSPAFYAVLTTENAPANTKVAARWFATDVGGVDTCNAQFSSYEMVVAGSGNPWFSTTPPLAG
ncbi:MAG TPA: hypothetical protein VJK29_20290, partial [Terriglobales bacterium]|nr:hypothetical protein [Terriglobales bacterium]